MKNKSEPITDKPIDKVKFPSHTSFLFHSIMTNSKIAGIIITDEIGTILEINPGVKKFFGYTESDVVGKNFSLLFTKEDQKNGNPKNELAMVLKTGSASDNNYVVHNNGTNIWVHGESILGQDESGKIFIIKIIYDLHIQHTMEKKLINLNNDLNNFVYTASHDLKAPINNIEGLLHTLENTINNKENPEDIISMMKESVIKFKGILKDLAITGKKQGHAKEDSSLIQFKEMTEEVIYNLNDYIEKTSASVKYDFSLATEIDFARKNLRSIIHNLLSNALKYHRPGHKPQILMSTEKNDGFIIFKIQDNGLGIKESNIKKLFSLYQRFNPEIDGTGVGLTIVKRIIDNNGGKIEVESEVGKGSTFKVYLKLLK